MDLVLSLVAASIIFGLAAYFTRARGDRILIALGGGAVFALGNVGWDAFAERMSWWRYPGGANPLWYVGAGVAFAGVSLIAWRVDRRYGTRGLVLLFILFALYGLLRDFLVSRFTSDVIAFGGGWLPWVMNVVAWLSLSVFAVGVQVMLRPDPGAEPLRSR